MKGNKNHEQQKIEINPYRRLILSCLFYCSRNHRIR
nr:MAG TPA: hypothetical protein [Caudoviricetes sp.]